MQDNGLLFAVIAKISCVHLKRLRVGKYIPAAHSAPSVRSYNIFKTAVGQEHMQYSNLHVFHHTINITAPSIGISIEIIVRNNVSSVLPPKCMQS